MGKLATWVLATIVGVMPSTFDFGEFFAPGIRVDLYVPVVLDITRNWGNTMAILGRLARPSVSRASAASALGIPV